MIGIIDYGLGNLSSVLNAFNSIKCSAEIFDNPKNVKKYKHIVLPGVGSFEAGIKTGSNSEFSNILLLSEDTISFTYPEPELIADFTDIIAAPGYFVEPDINNVFPLLHLLIFFECLGLNFAISEEVIL